jgi:hypothetical protein
MGIGFCSGFQFLAVGFIPQRIKFTEFSYRPPFSTSAFGLDFALLLGYIKSNAIYK